MHLTTALRAPSQPRRLPALACLLALLLAACGGGHDDSAADAGAQLALYGRADAAGGTVEAQAFRTGAPAATATAEATEEGLFTVSLPQPVDDVRIAVRTADGAQTLSAYLPAVTPSTRIHVNAVTTLADRVRLRGALPPAAAQARVAAFLGLPPGASPQAMYLAFANYYRGREADGRDFTDTLARLDQQLERDRAAYRKLWPADQRMQHLLDTRRQDQTDWFMPTTKYYEQQHRISNATGQKVTQWLYRDFLDYAKAQKKSIGAAVVAAGAPASLGGTGKNAVFLLNEDLQEQRCDYPPFSRVCTMVREHTGYVVFDLANASNRDYKVRRPKNNRGHPDMTRPVPGNYHYIYARELTPADRALWKVPKP